MTNDLHLKEDKNIQIKIEINVPKVTQDKQQNIIHISFVYSVYKRCKSCTFNSTYHVRSPLP